MGISARCGHRRMCETREIRHQRNDEFELEEISAFQAVFGKLP
jgi:hypothetical protein